MEYGSAVAEKRAHVNYNSAPAVSYSGRTMTGVLSPKQKALVGSSDEWMRRSMETVFQEKGYQVTRTGSGKEALRLAQRGGFDVIMLDERIDQLSGIDVCIALRDDPLFDHAAPIVVVSSAHSSLPSRTAAYAAGCWEYCHQPVDVDGLFLKLSTFLRARRELAEHQSQSLMDPSSGLYTEFGLEQLAEQLEARAVRNHEPIACVALASEAAATGNRGSDTESTAFGDLANAVRNQARRSDVIAKKGESQLAVLAPDTDAAGARLFVASYSPTHTVAQGLDEALDWYVERAQTAVSRAVAATPRQPTGPTIIPPHHAGTPLTLAAS
jgi:DNA-binding response OmpR family regulator